MKLFFKVVGYFCLTIIVLAYLGFLFVLPNVVNLEEYKSDLQKIVNEQAHLNIDYKDAKIITTPALGVGIKANDLTVKYEDGEEIFSADSLKTRVALPSLLVFTVKVSCLEIENPKVNLTIEDGKNLKILQHFDKVLTEQEKTIGEKPEVEEAPPIDISNIRIKVPNVKLKNYEVLVTDKQTKNYLTLDGEELKLGYFNGKTAKIKTNAYLKSNEETKVNANIDIDTFLPPPTKLDEEDDEMQRAELPYANIVEIYRTYDLQTTVNAKLKVREKNGNYKLNGFLDIDDLTLKLSNYTLPPSYAHMKFEGYKVFTDTDLSIADHQNIKLFGLIDYSKKPKLDLEVYTDRIYFNSVLSFAKGIFDTLQIPHDLNHFKTEGYIFARTKVKTNFKKLKSEGLIYVREGNFINNKTGLKIKDANVTVLLDNNTLEVKDSKMFIDGTPLEAKGLINEKSIADIEILTNNLPLKGLYNTFAPYDVKNAYLLNSGNLTLNVKLTGELKKSLLTVYAGLSNFSLSDKVNTFVLSNELAEVKFNFIKNELNGALKNKNFKLSLPQSKSVIADSDFSVDVDNKNIVVNPSKITINKNSMIDISAQVQEWQKTPLVDALAKGKLNALDLKQLAGKDCAMFINAKGVIPLEVTYSGKGTRQNLLLQILADNNNYITPVNIDSLYGRPSVIQTKVAFKGTHLKIKETGLFERISRYDEETKTMVTDLKKVVGVDGTIVDLNSPIPFVNLITVDIPEELKISINGFKKADFLFGGKLFVFGNSSSPRYKGGFWIKDLQIEDLLMSMKELDLGFISKELKLNLDTLSLNSSDIDIKSNISLEESTFGVINSLDLYSDNIDVDKMMKVVEASAKFTPQPQPANKTSQPADIPVTLKDGSIRIDALKTGNINISNITGRINLLNNIFGLSNLNANAFDGRVNGDISMNLVSNILRARLSGNNLDANKAAVDAAGLKDTITGRLDFNTDIALNVATTDYLEQMKSLDGTVNFDIKDGQIGPFGKLENMILAENIRESAFFQTALGGVINNIATIDTTHFKSLNGNLSFKDGIAKINSIKSSGNVLNMLVFGDMNLLNNEIDSKVRVELGSGISNMLGPIAQLNPINLVKQTPGLNIVMAKSFALFCEEVTPQEMNEIPAFEDKNANLYATKFQIVLKGDTAKPLSLVKSFKWLATTADIQAAENFVASLPEPEYDSDGNLLQTAEEIEAYNSKFSTKFKKSVKRFFKKFNKEDV